MGRGHASACPVRGYAGVCDAARGGAARPAQRMEMPWAGRSARRILGVPLGRVEAAAGLCEGARAFPRGPGCVVHGGEARGGCLGRYGLSHL